MYSSGNETVDKIGSINIEGNVIPFNWFSEFKFKNGKPDLNAIVILSEIVYWYRPKIVRDEETGVTKGLAKRFKADLLQRSYDSFAKQFGLTKRQVKEAFDRLCEHGVVCREFRTVQTENIILFNVLFIDLNADLVSSVSLYQGGAFKSSTLLRSNVPPHTLKRNTNTETTTETTTDISNTHFDEFWKAYPNKKARKIAEQKFLKINFKKNPFEKIMVSLDELKKTDDWTKENGKYIPMASTWINGERWNDVEAIKIVRPNEQPETPVQPKPLKVIRKNYLD